MCKDFCTGVDGVRHPALFGWIVDSTGYVDNAGIRGKMWAEVVEEVRVADMVHGKGLFEAVFGVLDSRVDLEPGIEDESLNGGIAFFRVSFCESANIAETGQIKREKCSITLACDFVDGGC